MAQRTMMSERMMGIAPFVVTLASGGMLALAMPNAVLTSVVVIVMLAALPLLLIRQRRAAAQTRRDEAARRGQSRQGQTRRK